MCGRFVSTNQADRISEFFGTATFEQSLDLNYNVAPTNEVYAVTANVAGARDVAVFRWGLVPSWAKTIKVASTMINARSETVAEKPAFKRSFLNRRLLIPMDGFYEWRRTNGTKQPMFIHRVDGQPLAVAGIWAAWRDPSSEPDAPWLHTCSILTTAANETMAPIHDRMPVILPPSRWEPWLDPSNHHVDELTSMLKAAPRHLLTMHAVSPAVNSVRNRGAELIEPVGPTDLFS